MLTALVQGLCTAAVVAASGCDQRQTLAPDIRAEVRARVDTSLSPVADTHVRFDLPNSNQGASLTLQVSVTGKNRALLTWDTASIRQAVAGGTLDSARLELTISQADNNWGAAGRTIGLHRMTQAWTEAGATWNCAVDAIPSNQTHDCTGATVWQMGSATSPPFVSTPTASAVITNGQTGVVTFDVSADVSAILAGTQTHYGWLLRKAAEDSAGAIRFFSREGATKPRLVLTVAQDTSRPAVPAYGDTPDDSLFVIQNPADTLPIYYRRIFRVVFSDSASGTVVRSFLARYQAQIVNGIPIIGAYIIQTSDPGPTWTDFQARLAAMRAEPGVDIVSKRTRRDYPPGIRGRYPSDGLRRSRGAWFPGPDTAMTQAQRVIRAPLAWGCETGEYGTFVPRVGILEWAYDSSFADLPSQRSMFRLNKSLGLTVSNDSDHGTIVASVLAGVGDNGSGVAGMIWRSDLKLYAMTGAGNRLPTDAVESFLAEIVEQVVADQPNVLSISIAFGESGDLSARLELQRALTKILTNSPTTLLVMAIGNDDVSFSPQDYLNIADRTVFGLEQAIVGLRQQGLFTDRFLFVAGTARPNRRWSYNAPGQGSTEIIGMTDIAAPAESVAVMGTGGIVRLAGATENDRGGTSLAAPMVAGTAALLLAMEPTLEPGDLRDYLMRGAQVARLNPRTGTDSLPQSATGFTGSVFQLDAYGSLTLLARERPGTPICGYPVWVRSDIQVGEVTLESGGPSARTLQVPGATGDLSRLSVAQGGRLISVYNQVDFSDPSVNGSIVMNHQGDLVSPKVNGRRRVFLERDTVDAIYNAALGYERFTYRRADGSTQENLDLVASARAQTPVYFETWGVELSPAGDLASVITRGISREECTGADSVPLPEGLSTDRLSWFRVTVPGGAALPLGSRDYVVDLCGDTFDQFGGAWTAWSHDGRAAVASVNKVLIDGRVVPAIVGRMESDGGYAESTVLGLVQAPRFTADDSLVIAGGFDASFVDCTRQARKAATPWEAVGPTTAGFVGADCFFPGEQTDKGGPVIPNTPRHQISGRPGRARGGAFDLGTPARTLPAAGVRAMSAGASVQVN